MTSIPQQTLNAYEQVLGKLSTNAQGALERALSSIDFRNKQVAIKQIEEVVVALTGASTEVASLIGADFYDEISRQATGVSVNTEAYNSYNPKGDFVAINALMHSVQAQEDEAKFINEMLERLDMQIRKSANDSVIENGYHDKRRPRFARVPDSPKPCLFCIMLASRGAVYYSKESAGEGLGGTNRYHNNCKCKIVPVFDDMSIENYDPQELYEQWQKKYTDLAKKRSKRNGTTVQEEIKRYKRKMQEGSEKAYEKRKLR